MNIRYRVELEKSESEVRDRVEVVVAELLLPGLAGS